MLDAKAIDCSLFDEQILVEIQHLRPQISPQSFEFQRRTDNIEREKELDGIHVIRTSVPKGELSACDVVRTYEKLSRVERALRRRGDPGVRA